MKRYTDNVSLVLDYKIYFIGGIRGPFVSIDGKVYLFGGCGVGIIDF